MGGCFGLCISKILDPISNRFYRSHTRMSSEEDEQVEKRNKGSTLQLIEDDDDWTMNCNKYILLHSKNAASTSYDSDTSLRSTDPQKIIRDQRGISSTPASSLDLEWETEGIPLHALGTNQKEKSCNSSIKTADNSHPSSLTASPWSRVSSPDSLEWDPIEADIVCLDLETERLITEIERLTDKTLRETGDWTVTS